MTGRKSESIPRYRMVLTDDGSLTLYSSEFDEAMHSSSGAYDEAVRKHIIPSGILGHQKEEVRVLDVGFGLGYNCLALLQEMARLEWPMFTKIISLERDSSALPHLKEIRFHDSRDALYRTVLHALEFGAYVDERYSLTITKGDARESIQALPRAHFDAIFQDAFSPAKNPELWSVDYFREMARIITPSGILTTYSCARHVRKAMLEAGFSVGKGPAVGAKREGTIASLSEVIAMLTEQETTQLLASPGIIFFRDPDLRDSREHILIRREDEMARVKQGHQVHG